MVTKSKNYVMMCHNMTQCSIYYKTPPVSIMLKVVMPTLCHTVHCLGCSNHSVLVLEVVVEAHDQIPHDIPSLHRSIL